MPVTNDSLLYATQYDAYDDYRCKLMVSDSGYIDVRRYGNFMLKKKTSMELINPESKESSNKEGRKAADPNELKEIRFDSLTRTRKMVIEYAAQNAKHFKSFVTLTFKENEKDLEKANTIFHTYIDQVRREVHNNNQELYYLCIPEFQKRGAVHYHFFSSLACGSELIPKREPKHVYSKKTKKMRLIEYYDVKFWPHGYSTAFDLTTTNSNFNLAIYMCKYLFKDIDHRLFGKTKVLKSNNLEKPKYYFMRCPDAYDQIVNRILESDYNITYYKAEIKEGDTTFNDVEAIQATLDEFDLQDITEFSQWLERNYRNK